MSSQLIRKLVRYSLAMNVLAFTFSASMSFANVQQSFFHFTNGNKAVFKMSGRNQGSGYRVFLYQSGQKNSAQEIHRSTVSLKTIEYHEDSENSPKMGTGIVKNLAKDSTSTFTWFQDLENNYILFEDGTLSPVSFPDPISVSAKLIVYQGEKYMALSYSYATGESTQLLRLSDARAIELDNQYHGNLHQGQEVSLADDGVLSISHLSEKVDLKNFDNISSRGKALDVPSKPPLVEKAEDPLPRITYGTETYELRVEKSTGSQDGGTFIVRLSDSKKLKVDVSPLDLKNDRVELSESNGILSIWGLVKKVDLKAFDAEVQRFSHLREGDRVRDQSNYLVDVATTLSEYVDLVAQARKNPEKFKEKSDPKVIQGIAESVRGRRSAVVLGKAGTGKSSSIRAFARDISQGLVPGFPRTLQIFQVNMINFESGTENVGRLEKKLAALISAAQQTGCIYFIDELHSMRGVGTHSHKSNDIGEYMKTAMGLGELVILGTDTSEEYELAFGGDAGFMRRLKQIEVSEPSGKELIEIVRASMKRDHENVVLDTSIIEEAIRLSSQYDLTVAQPGAAVSLLSAAFDKMGNRGLENQPVDQEALKEAALTEYKFDPALFSRDLTLERLSHLEDGLKLEVVGQSAAKEAVVSVWERKFTSVGDPKKVNSILFVGPPGVGKTKVAEATADLMNYKKTVIEMNQYALGGIENFRREVYKAIRQGQFRVIVLDEFEKADVSVQQGALSMFESGKFTVQVPHGDKTVSNEVSAKHVLFMLTSNAAGDYIAKESYITDKDLRERLMAGGISDTVLSRIQYVIPMRNPNEADYKAGIRLYLESTLARESKEHQAHFILVKKGTDLEKVSAKLRAVIDPTTEKTQEQYSKDYEQIINFYVNDYVESMSSTFTKYADDFRDIQRMMIKIEEKIAKALLKPGFEPGQWIFIEWDASFIPEKAEPPKSDAYSL